MAKAKKTNYSNGTTYKIDKGVPITRKKTDVARFPFDKMKIGDSFLVPTKDQSADKARCSLFTAVKSFNAHNAKSHKIATRREKGGLRVWRIK